MPCLGLTFVPDPNKPLGRILFIMKVSRRKKKKKEILLSHLSSISQQVKIYMIYEKQQKKR